MRLPDFCQQSFSSAACRRSFTERLEVMINILFGELNSPASSNKVE